MLVLTEAKYHTDQEFKAYQATLNRYKNKDQSTKIEYRDSLLLRLAQHTSAREAEVLGVRPIDVGVNSVTVFGVKGSNDRTIPLPKSFCKELRLYANENNIADTSPIFPMTTRHFRRVYSLYRPNPKKGAHCMRHTGALKLAKKTKDPQLVQYYLGHKSITNTMVYINYLVKQSQLKHGMAGMWGQALN